METQTHAFYSDGIRLEGLLQLPDPPTVAPYPTLVLCSGFQGLKELIPAKLWGTLTAAGYACFAFDYRGIGTSEGERGRLLPLEQVEDARNAVTYLQTLPEVRRDAIGLVGWGLGGGIVVQVAALDRRVRAVACLNGLGDGGRAVRDSRPYHEWLALQREIAEDRTRRTRTGRSRLVSPWVVVPLDPTTRANVDADMYGHHPRFASADVSLQSAEAYYAFKPERVAHEISPRPLLIVHGALNELHPIDEAHSLYAHAGEPKELLELPTAHHLDWIQPGDPLYPDAIARIVAWLGQHLPADGDTKRA
jgi:pimeloyl-ACP methyl ester carboxylesterase